MAFTFEVNDGIKSIENYLICQNELSVRPVFLWGVRNIPQCDHAMLTALFLS